MEMINIALNIFIMIVIIAVAYMVLWTGFFYPITLLRKHRKEKKDLEDEVLKIKVQKAELADLIKGKSDEYDSVSRQVLERKIELEKVEARIKKAQEQMAIKNNKSTSKSKEKSKQALPDNEDPAI